MTDEVKGAKKGYKHSDLLALLNSRKAWEGKPYVIPETNTAAVDGAAALHARANDSDPFARARITLYLRNGYDLPSDVSRDANAAIARRSTEPRGEFASLEFVKKRLDADRAWNQHRTDMYVKGKEVA